MDSPEPSPSWWRRVRRALLRWSPVFVLLPVTAGAGVAVRELGPPPPPPHVEPAGRLATPVLSVRRAPTLFAEPIAEQRLAGALRDFVTTQPPDTCLVVRAGDDRVLFDHRGDDAQVPASTHKLLTAAAALLALGPDHRFVTRVVSSGPPVEGVIAGDLHLVGGGDPLLATSAYVARFGSPPQPFTDIGSLAAGVAEVGITRVDGAIVGDESRFDRERYNPEWPARFVTQGQSGPQSALSVNDGFASFPADNAFPGTPAGDPAALAASVFSAELAARGVEVSGAAASGPAPEGGVVIAEVASPPLHEVVGQMLTESDNGTAELILKELGAHGLGEGSVATGRVVVADTLADAGFTLDHVAVADGSGLADPNRTTCRFLSEVLARDDLEDDLAAGLAVAGRTGTLRTRWADTPLAGRVRAKTGTLNQVTGLAGYVDTLAGVRMQFALVVNVEAPAVVSREIVASQQTLAELLAAHPAPVDLTAYGPKRDR